MKYCTYISKHPSGFEYRGKGQTKAVEAGKYKGSGTRFKLTCMNPGFELSTWTTTIVEKFHTANDAYIAEAELITLQDLHNPWLLNDTAGGRKGAYQTRNTLMRNYNSAARALSKAKKKEKERLKVAELKSKIKELSK